MRAADGGWLERLLQWLAPRLAYRRRQFREALRQEQEHREPLRQPEGGGWMRIDDPANPINRRPVAAPKAWLDERRRWTW